MVEGHDSGELEVVLEFRKNYFGSAEACCGLRAPPAWWSMWLNFDIVKKSTFFQRFLIVSHHTV